MYQWGRAYFVSLCNIFTGISLYFSHLEALPKSYPTQFYNDLVTYGCVNGLDALLAVFAVLCVGFARYFLTNAVYRVFKAKGTLQSLKKCFMICTVLLFKFSPGQIG